MTMIEHLTRREHEVLALLAQGKRNQQIADQLHITRTTARDHVTTIMQKLGASSRTEDIITALKQGLTQL